MSTLSARDMFKKAKEYKKRWENFYWPKEKDVIKYGKINKIMAYRIIEKPECPNCKYSVEIVTSYEDGNFAIQTDVFWNETKSDVDKYISKKIKKYSNIDIDEYLKEINKKKVGAANIGYKGYKTIF